MCLRKSLFNTSSLGSAVVPENNIAFVVVSCIVRANKVRSNKLAAIRPSLVVQSIKAHLCHLKCRKGGHLVDKQTNLSNFSRSITDILSRICQKGER